MIWRKSSYSLANGNCVIAGNERKPRRSVGNGACFLIGNWREAGDSPQVVGVRDSKLGDASPVLEFSPAAWRKFTSLVKVAL